jgi:hypothetical protein
MFDARGSVPPSRTARRALTAIAVAAALVAGASLPALAEKPVDLVLSVPAGKTFHYKLDNQTEINNEGSTMSATSSGSISMTRGADAPSKNLVFDITIAKLEMSRRMGDKLETQDLGLDGAKLQAEVTPRGKVVKVDPVTTLDQQQLKIAGNLVDVLFVDLPEKPVKTGDTFTADLGKADGSSVGKGDFTIDEIAKKGGRQVAKMSGPVAVESKVQSFTGKGTFEAAIAVDGGYTISAKGKIDLKSNGPSVQQVFELKLVE